MNNLQLAINNLTSSDKEQLVINKIKRTVYVDRGNGIMMDVATGLTIRGISEEDYKQYTKFWLSIYHVPDVESLIVRVNPKENSGDVVPWSHMFAKVNGWKTILLTPTYNDLVNFKMEELNYNGRLYFLTDDGSVSSVSIKDHYREFIKL